MDKPRKKIEFKKIAPIFLLLFLFSSFLINIGIAQALVEAGGDVAIRGMGENTFAIEEGGEQVAVVQCKAITSFEPAKAADIGALMKCMETEKQTITDSAKKNILALQKKQMREELIKQIEEKAREVLAVSFKASLKAFSRQIAHDTAVWVASGGKGQKPLFITEGWGAYLKNAADSALGDFIDNIGQSYGVDLCKPDISIRVAIETGINWQQPRKVRCTFTQMMNSWEDAVNNPNFSFEYTNAMRPGENDVSVFLTLQSQSFQTVAEEVNTKVKEAETNDLWTDIKDFTGKILTPGTEVADQFRRAEDKADIGVATFTNTIADIVEEFLNTLVSQLLDNLKSGLFSSNSGGNSSKNGLPFELPDLSSLFNPDASPRTVEGASGATDRFRELIPTDTRIGGPYNIITKLQLCTEQSKDNLGPTDCVIDPILALAIQQKTQVKDLPQEVLNRVFAPPISEVANPQVAFTERNIKILRKYRIVPVGWEVVAEKIRNAPEKKTYTLAEILNDNDLKQYIDPFWVLTAPELFCRQLGYGAHNSDKNSQDGSITRDEYCADEQQCIQNNQSGNCSAYGYCTEERRYWDFGDKTCQPRFNTCETFTGRDNLKDSWLVNSLDFRQCDETNYGCRWLSASFNTVDSVWEHLEPEGVMIKCDQVGGCGNSIGSPSPTIKQGRTMTDDRRIIMGQACSSDACANENLISNGGFENGFTGFAAESGINATTVTTNVKSGKYSLELDNTTGGNLYMNVVNPITFFAGKKYVISAYVYIEGGGADNVYLDIFDTVVTTVGVFNRWVKISYTTTTASDVAVRPRLVLGNSVKVYVDDFQVQEVGKGKCIYSEESKTCSFYQGNCTTTNGGVMCAVDNCQVGNNLLEAFNGDFEDSVAGMDFRAAKWNFENSYYNLDNRQFREAKKNGDGYNLAIEANNNPKILETKLDNIPLTPGKRYALNFSMREDYLNAGAIAIGLFQKENDAPLGGLSLPVLPSFWQEYKFEFDVPANVTSSYLIVAIPAKTLGMMYVDDIVLKEVDKACNANSIWLTEGITPEISKEIYFNGKTPACNGAADGCSQFIRTKPGLGSNLIVNGSFDAATSGWEFINDGGGNFTFISDDKGNYAKVTYDAMVPSSWKAIDIIPGTYYIISMDAARTPISYVNPASRFEIYLAEDKVNAAANSIAVLDTDCTINDPANPKLTLYNYPAGTDFERKSCRFLAPEGAYALRYKVFGGWSGTNDIYVDNIKLEPVFYNVESPSAFTDYNPNSRPANQVAYLKKAPEFFQCYRSTSTGQWANSSTLWNILAGQTPVCKNYAPVCTRDEVGCELYRPVNGDPAVPGIVDALDICPGECNGYSVYRQEPTYFVSSKYRQFIADATLKYCSAAYAGCDEFTNLDKLGQGAEAREYFVSFRACEKTSALNAQTYYTWEGSDTLGYQLKVYKLKESTLDGGNAPCTYIQYTSNVPTCMDNHNVGNAGHTGYCTRDDMFVNPDCREFYNASNGTSTYRLLSRTISVSDDCHPYRRTQTQLGSGEAQADCSANQGYWSNNACVYMAIPSQGRTCPSSVMGCREFTGNRANNVRNLINSNFGTNSVSTSSWQDGNGGTSGLQISTESSFVGGYSIINVNPNYVIKHPVEIAKGRAYTLSFWAKSKDGSDVTLSNIRFSGFTGAENSFNLTIASATVGSIINTNPVVTAEWKKFDLGPVFVTSTPGNDEYLEFQIPNTPSVKEIYLDNVILKEVREDIFAVDNSWFTPLACDNKLGDGIGEKAIKNNTCTSTAGSIQGTRCFPGEMVGCAAYKDRANTVNYFRSFARLCRQEAAGCEALIDTYNYAPAGGKVFNDGDKSSTTVKADETVYLVNDRKYACRDSEKGCTAYGLPMITPFEEVAGFNTVYLLNNPDVYNQTLCKFDEVWCDQYIGSNSVRYFKNPHGRVCGYEVRPGQLEGQWYIRGTDEICTTTADQTLGTGYGKPSDKYQPIGLVDNVTGAANTGYGNWVGACPASQSGCSEVADPLPYVYTPLRLENNKATVKVNTFYAVVNGEVQSFDNRGGVARMYFPDQSQSNTLKRFYISCPKDNSACQNENLEVTVSTPTTRLSKVGVYYVFDRALDRTSCNGLSNYDSGCVLVNNRSSMDFASNTAWSDRVSKYLVYDSYSTYRQNRHIFLDNLGREVAGKIEAISPQSGQNDSNLIIKVKPDRICNSWLACTTYEKKGDSVTALFSNNDRCLSVGLCDSLNEQGACDHFIEGSTSTVFDANSPDANKSGYSFLSDQGTVGYYSYNQMPQLGEAANVSNGNFEISYGAGTTQKRVGEISKTVKKLAPMGWQTAFYNCVDGCTKGYPREKVFDLDGLEIESNVDIKMAKEGSSMLQVNSGYGAISEYVELDGNTDYYLSTWVNTKDLGGNNDSTNPARAEIQLRFFNATNTIFKGIEAITVPDPSTFSDTYGSDGKSPSSDGYLGGWLYSDSLKIERGLPWQHVIFHFRTATSSYRMQIALMNMNPKDANVIDNNTNFGGYTLWDDVQVKPLLKVNDTQLVNRSCRVYPDQKAPACRYVSGNNSYYGMYGYCLLDDPANPGQCLQWWPVDNIKGEVLDDFSPYYRERSPLYYCLHKSLFKYYFFGANVLINTSDKLPEEMGGLLEGSTEVKYSAFSIPESSRPLFRYPYIYKIPVKIVGGGVGLDKGVYVSAFFADMYPKRVCPFGKINTLIGDVLGRELCFSAKKTLTEESRFDLMGPASSSPAEECGAGVPAWLKGVACWFEEFGAKFENLIENVLNLVGEIKDWINDALAKVFETFVILPQDEWGGFAFLSLGMQGVPIAIPIPMPWHVGKQLQGGSGGLFTAVSGFIDAGLGGGTVGVKIITDGSGEGNLGDPVPGLKGDILGYASFMDVGMVFGSGAPIIFSDGYNVEYCDTVAQVVNSSGQNKAWSTRLTQGSSYRSIASDCIRDSALGGSGFGEDKCFYASDYCLHRDCLLNNQQICDFCDNFVGKIEGNNIVNIYRSAADPMYDISDQVCPQFSGNFTCSGTIKSDSRGEMTRLMKDGNECPEYFCYEYKAGFYNAIRNLLSRLQFTDSNQYVYKKIYSENKYGYGGDYTPYGSVVPPADALYPQQWDSRPDIAGNQPLFYEMPNTTVGAPYQARMGQVHSQTSLQQLFGQTYGIWRYDGSSQRYLPVFRTGYEWGLPEYCSTAPRPTTVPASFCRIRPVIENEVIQNQNRIVSSNTPVIAKLSFNVKVDADQLPIRSYSVWWGDGSITSYSGVSLAARPSASSTFTLYHYYARKGGTSAIVALVIKIKDNWNAIQAKIFTYDLESGATVPVCNCDDNGASCPSQYVNLCLTNIGGTGTPPPAPGAGDFIQGGRGLQYGDVITLYNNDGARDHWVYYGVTSDKVHLTDNDGTCCVDGVDKACAGGNNACFSGLSEAWKQFQVCDYNGDCTATGNIVAQNTVITLKSISTGDFLSAWCDDADGLGSCNVERYLDKDIDAGSVGDWERFRVGKNTPTAAPDINSGETIFFENMGTPAGTSWVVDYAGAACTHDHDCPMIYGGSAYGKFIIRNAAGQ